ncbi:hypothetical protein LCGC14_1191120 [marine sediment metagenome]|uniref:Uncharacterized protein n=1 Tax=marine sediment metagenome TaxID=412755 RepID=A0A0F9LP36_9ZZZZ
MICGKKECQREYYRENSIAYRKDPKNKKKIRGYSREYNQLPEVKKKQNTIRRMYQRALHRLKENHEEEFKEIYKKLKQKGIKGYEG